MGGSPPPTPVACGPLYDPYLCPSCESPSVGTNSVGVVSGNNHLGIVDLPSIANFGPSMDFVRHYSSLSQYNGPFGKKWSHSFNMQLIEIKDDGSLLMIDGSGATMIFFKHASNTGEAEESDYQAPPGIHATIKKLNDNEFLYKTKDGFQVKFKFMNAAAPSWCQPITYMSTVPGTGSRTGGSVINFGPKVAKPVWMEDSNGNRVSFDYDDGRLEKIRHEVNGDTDYYIEIVYNQDHLIKEVKEVKGTERLRHILYEYDDGNLVLVKDFEDGTTIYKYDSGNITKITYPNGKSYERFGYEQPEAGKECEAGVCIWTENNTPGSRIALIYDRDNSKTTVMDSKENITVYNYQMIGGIGLVTSITDAQRNTTQYTWDGDHNLSSFTDAKGYTKSYAYDGKSNLTQVSYPLDNITVSYTYEPTFNNIETVTDAKGNVTRYNYNAIGDIVSPNISSIVDAMDNTTYITYNEHGQIKTIKDSLEHTKTFEYDPRGNLTAMIDPLGNRTEMTYDPLNRLVSLTDAEGNTTVYTYYGNTRNITSVTDAVGNVTVYNYDVGNGCSACSASSGLLLTKITDAKGHITQFEYDLQGRTTVITNPRGDKEYFDYDGVGNLITYTDRNGQIISYKYNSLNRPTAKISSDDRVIYEYDSIGNLKSISDSDSQIDTEYDPLKRVKNVVVTLPGGYSTNLTYDYDKNGNRISMIEPNFGELKYDYDNLNRLTYITTPKEEIVEFGYDELSRHKMMKLPNGTRTDYSYYDNSQLKTLTHSNKNGIFESFAYTHDRVGNRKILTDMIGTHSYDYDNLYQLIGTAHPQASSPAEHFNYDPVGNRLDSHLSDSYQYDERNCLTEDDQYTYNYDNNGNLISRISKADGATTQYTYDTSNRLIRVDLPGGEIATYRYDPLGRRIEKNVNNIITRYIYDSEEILFELGSNNNVLAYYTHGLGIDEPLIMECGGQSYYYHTDGLGSVVMLTDSSGAVVQSYSYDSFGNIVKQDGGVLNPYTYTARELDAESGLYYYRARYYDPDAGRFISADPIRDINLYNYVYNNPINRIDPLGLDSFMKCWKRFFDKIPTWVKFAGAAIGAGNYIAAASGTTLAAAIGIPAITGAITIITTATVTVFIGSIIYCTLETYEDSIMDACNPSKSKSEPMPTSTPAPAPMPTPTPAPMNSGGNGGSPFTRQGHPLELTP